MLDKMEAAEIIIQGSCAQMRNKKNSQNRLYGVPEKFSSFISDLHAHITQAFPKEKTDQEKKEIAEKNILTKIIRIHNTAITVREIPTSNPNTPIYVCRNTPPKPPLLGSISQIHRTASQELSQYATNSTSGGIVLISSIPGRGNTFISASAYGTMIDTHGGVGLYISRTHPYDLNGPTSRQTGCTIQFQLPESEEEVNPSLIRALAVSPRLGFIDTITTPEDAKIALELASSGVLIFLAADAGSALSAIELLVTKASTAYGNLDTARNITASVLRAAIHVEDNDPEKTKYIFLGDPENNPANTSVSDKIRNGHIPTLKSNMDSQTSLITSGKSPIPKSVMQR